MNAIDFHSTITESFNLRYRHSGDFQERFETWTRLLDKYIPVNAQVLDAGCGTGVFSFWLADKGCAVTGFDGSSAMIDFCRQQQVKLPVSTITFIKDQLPLSPYSDYVRQEAVISSSVLEYVPDLKAAVVSLTDRLEPGGLFIYSLPNGQSLYRKLERLLFRFVGKPGYLQFVQHYGTPHQLQTIGQIAGTQVIEIAYYGGTSRWLRIARRLLSDKYVCSLLVVVSQKL